MKRFYNIDGIEAGVDEAGRGSLIGDVFAGAVIWDKEAGELQANDSKKLSPRRRLILRDYIQETAIDYGIGSASNTEIDTHNILGATIIAMHRAISALNVSPNLILVDGPNFKQYFDGKTFISHVCIINGDSLYESIAAGSILAKVYHDEHIQKLIEENPEFNDKYGLSTNMGYGTRTHMEGLMKYGPTKYHRQSFAPVNQNNKTIKL